jgi:hypothetical protein
VIPGDCGDQASDLRQPLRGTKAVPQLLRAR